MPDEAIAELSAAAAAELAASALASRGEEAKHCANCATPLIGPYCAACGQPTDTHRKSIWRLIWETVEHISNFDSRIMRTMRALLFQPGELPGAFKTGQTQRYVPAVRLYLFISLFFFLILSATGIALLQFEVIVTKDSKAASGGLVFASQMTEAERADIRRKAIEGKLSDDEIEKLLSKGVNVAAKTHFFSRLGTIRSSVPEVYRAQIAAFMLGSEKKPAESTDRWVSERFAQGMETIAREPAAVNGPLTAWIPRVLFLLLPLFALLLWLFYWRQRKQFLLVDHLVFSLTFHTFAFVILIAAALSVQAWPSDAVGWAALIIVLTYFFFSMKWFYGQNYFWTSMKFVAVSLLYTLFFLLPALGVVIFMSMVEA